MTKAAIFAAAALTSVSWAQAPTQGRQLTARELFYAAADQQAAKAAPARPAARPAPLRDTRERRRPAAPLESSTAVSHRETAPPPPATHHSGETRLTSVAYGASTPLGLRYSLLKQSDGRMVEVAPDAEFRAGDRIQVSVEANEAGYLYIVHQGSSGTWKPLFPSPEIEGGSNRVEKGRVYVMPPNARFVFDEQAGEEKLFVVLSRQPVPDLEQLIYQLRETPQSPAAEPARPRREPLLMAQVQIPESAVGNLRRVYARDLVIERVDDEAAPPKESAGRREKAVYVVNPSGSPESRVVADIRLTHR